MKSLCVGVDQSTGEGFIDDVFTSTRPTRTHAHAWHATTLVGQRGGVSVGKGRVIVGSR